MKTARSRNTLLITSGLSFLSTLFAASAGAAIIQNSNPDLQEGAFNADCGVPGQSTACIGGWNLDNVDVTLLSEDGIEFGSFDKETGIYTDMTYGDYFESHVRGDAEQMMARVYGKTWPVGEPTAIKIVVDDTQVSNGKPQNCIMGTAFLSPEKTELIDANFLDSAHPQPVVCSSPFQTHKRFKVGMLPDSAEGVTEGEGHGIDLVFNVQDDDYEALRSYQVFSKINNYTDKRLSGYKLVVGTGTGSAFVSASESGIADRLHLSLGRGEGAKGGANLTYDGSDLFHSLATFSHGLFGAPDKHFTENGFFDNRTAGFNVELSCVSTEEGACPEYANPLFDNTLTASDVIISTTPLESNYHQVPGPVQGLPFGEWLPSKWQPKGIFYDDDGDPETDAALIAWWDGDVWRAGFDDGFAEYTQAEIAWLAANPNNEYLMGSIEDVLNLGINYIIKVGNGIPDGQFTLRIIPVVSADQSPPAWCGMFGVCSEPEFDETLLYEDPDPDDTLNDDDVLTDNDALNDNDVLSEDDETSGGSLSWLMLCALALATMRRQRLR